MPFIDIKVIEGAFSSAERELLVEKVAEAVIEVEGEALRPVTHVAVTETPSGAWSVGGKALTTRDLRLKRAAGVS